MVATASPHEEVDVLWAGFWGALSAVSLIIGALVGILITTMATVRTSVSRRHLQKRLERTEHALEKSRAQNDRAL